MKRAMESPDGDRAAGHPMGGDHAGPRGHPIDPHRARPALAESATVLGAIEREVVAQHMQQRRRLGHTQHALASVDLQGEFRHCARGLPMR